MERSKPRVPQFTRDRRLRRWLSGAAGIAVVATLFAYSQQQPVQPSAGPAHPEKPYLLPEANRLPDANDRMTLQDQQSKKNKFEAANLERQKQIADDADHLLQLATELKAEVDKTGKDTLSLNVIRKAESIEKLAKGVKEKMKLTVGAS